MRRQCCREWVPKGCSRSVWWSQVCRPLPTFETPSRCQLLLHHGLEWCAHRLDAQYFTTSNWRIPQVCHEGEYLTAVREPAVFDTSHIMIIVSNLMGPGYSASVETKLNIFQEKMAKWCRIFLSHTDCHDEFATAYREIIKACGCDEDWMRRRARMFGHDYQHP